MHLGSLNGSLSNARGNPLLTSDSAGVLGNTTASLQHLTAVYSAVWVWAIRDGSILRCIAGYEWVGRVSAFTGAV